MSNSTGAGTYLRRVVIRKLVPYIPKSATGAYAIDEDGFKVSEGLPVSEVFETSTSSPSTPSTSPPKTKKANAKPAEEFINDSLEVLDESVFD